MMEVRNRRTGAALGGADFTEAPLYHALLTFCRDRRLAVGLGSISPAGPCSLDRRTLRAFYAGSLSLILNCCA